MISIFQVKSLHEKLEEKRIELELRSEEDSAKIGEWKKEVARVREEEEKRREEEREEGEKRSQERISEMFDQTQKLKSQVAQCQRQVMED